ncbi:MAG: HAMP domain-containing protein [Firmicutes bacterium]|nr:HAMP domain-containing protein [Bacillota bacterium]
MGRSIRWRLIIIYLLLILVAMELTGVYLIQALEKYYISSYTTTVVSQAQLVAGFLERYMAGDPDRSRISQLVQEFGRQSRFDIVVLGPNGTLIGSSGDNPKELERALNKSEISRALSGGRGQTVGIAPATGDSALHLVEPIRLGERIAGLVYVIASLEGTYRTLADIRTILVYSALLALGVTAVLGLIVSQTITGPIEEITAKARRMAAGDFQQTIEVRSDDEIGQLAAMFNHLTNRLRDTLSEISGEKSKLEVMLTNMADGVVAVDGCGAIMAMNPAAGRMLGMDPGGSIGKPLSGPLADSADRFKVADRTLVARYAPIKGGGPDGAGGERAGTVIVLQDVTEAERLDRLRREFVANVSHELRTPLTSVKSYVETLADGAVEDPALTRQFLTTVSKETDRMNRLVRDLLELASLDQNDTLWDRRPIALGDAVIEAVTLIRPQTDRKGISLQVDLPDNLPLVMADSDRMQQVALNILANAVEFTPSGGQVTVSACARAGGVHVVIRDSGIGIPREDLPRIFERFYRVDKARSRELGGTGLGLSIAREIVLAHGGDIAIRSRVGEGTEVEFWVPVSGGTCGGGVPE